MLRGVPVARPRVVTGRGPTPLVQQSAEAQSVLTQPNKDEVRKKLTALKREIRETREALEEYSISTVTESIDSDEEKRKLSVVTLFKPSRQSEMEKEETLTGTVHDPRMGVFKAGKLCKSCSKPFDSCEGHFGLIDFGFFPGLPDRITIPNPFALDGLITTMNIVCPECATPYYSEEVAKDYGILNKQGYARAVCMKDTRLGSAEVIHCRHSMKPANPQDKPCDTTPWVYRLGRVPEALRNKDRPSLEKWKDKGDRGTHIYRFVKGKPVETTIEYVPFKELWKTLDRIKPKDAELMGFTGTHPRDFMMSSMLVTPINKRSPSFIDGRWEFDLASMDFDRILAKTIELSGHNSGKLDLTGRAIQERIREDPDVTVDKLYALVSATLIRDVGTSKRKNLAKKLKGKDGLVRKNLQGKRVDYSARGPAGPAPDLDANEIGVPIMMAQKLTYPEKVTSYNIDWLQSLLEKGEVTFINQGYGPKAGIEIPVNDEIRYGYELQIGDTARRWCQNGDPLIVNRQPSLHKWNFMVMRAVVGKHTNIRANTAITQAYNLDHDGDELNLHAPQSEQARAEALLLLNAESNQFDDRTMKAMVKPLYDVNTAAFILTQSKIRKAIVLETVIDERDPSKKIKRSREIIVEAFERYVDPDLFPQLWYRMTEPRPDPEALYARFFANKMRFNVRFEGEEYEVEYGSRDIAYLGFRTDNGFRILTKGPSEQPSPVILNLKNRQLYWKDGEKELSKKAVIAWSGSAVFSMLLPESLNMEAGEIVIENGCLKAGATSKSTFGDGTGSISHRLLVEYGNAVSLKFTNDASYMLNLYLAEYGFSVGAGDFLFADNEKTKKEVKTMVNKAFNDIIKLGPKQSDPSKERFRKAQILSKLNITNAVGSKIVDQDLDVLNPVSIMTKGAATKGGPANVSQIGAGLMQQYNREDIFEPTLAEGERTLPYYPFDDNHPRYGGFAEHSFVEGLDPDELMFHLMSSRQAMMASHTVLPTFGHLRRLLARLCEDIKVGADGSVRMKNTVVQTAYGGSGLSNRLIFVRINGKKIPTFFDIRNTIKRSLGQELDEEELMEE